MAQEFQQWIKYCNPQCKVISAPKGVISRCVDMPHSTAMGCVHMLLSGL